MKLVASKDLEKGVWYRIRHRRQGEAVIEVTEAQADGCTGIIRAGRLRGIHVEYQPGAAFSTSNNLATFEKISDVEMGSILTAKRFTVEEGFNGSYRVKDMLTESTLHSGLSKEGAEQRADKLNVMEHERAFAKA